MPHFATRRKRNFLNKKIGGNGGFVKDYILNINPPVDAYIVNDIKRANPDNTDRQMARVWDAFIRKGPTLVTAYLRQLGSELNKIYNLSRPYDIIWKEISQMKEQQRRKGVAVYINTRTLEWKHHERLQLFLEIENAMMGEHNLALMASRIKESRNIMSINDMLMEGLNENKPNNEFESLFKNNKTAINLQRYQKKQQNKNKLTMRSKTKHLNSARQFEKLRNNYPFIFSNNAEIKKCERMILIHKLLSDALNAYTSGNNDAFLDAQSALTENDVSFDEAKKHGAGEMWSFITGKPSALHPSFVKDLATKGFPAGENERIREARKKMHSFMTTSGCEKMQKYF